MHKIKITKKLIAGLIVLIMGILLIGVYVYYNVTLKHPFHNGNEDNEIVFEVKKGEGITSLLDRLSDDDIIKSELVLKVKVKLDSINPTLIEGEYKIDADDSFDDFLKIIQEEDTSINQMSITIPEGYTIDDMAKLFEEKGLFSKTDFINAIKNYKLPDYIVKNDKKKYNLEGYLYPNTYSIKKDSTPDEVIKILNDEFNKILEEVKKEQSFDDKDLDTIITKASLIEKEVKIPKEKPIVASVIENRLKKNMKLEFCSTIHYLIGYEGHEKLYYKDLDVDSPYNTYKYEGLPIGPITTPTKSSILAVLKPDKTDYYFFLTKDDSSHIFSKTGEEHEALKNQN